MHGITTDILRVTPFLLTLTLVACGDDVGSATSTATDPGTGPGTSAGSVDDTAGSTMTTAPGTSDDTTAGTTEAGDASTTSAESTATGSGTTDATGTGSDGTDSTGATGDSSTGDPTTGGEQLATCSAADLSCPDDSECFLDMCPACQGEGVCVPVGAATCGGFIGQPCPVGQSCLLWGECIADGSGRCLPDDVFAAACAEQANCWSCG